MDVTGLADPYVKIYLLYNGQRISKKKTHVKKRTLSPVFNESFAFDIPTTEVSLTIKMFNSVFNYNILTGCWNELRRCFIGANAIGLG